MALIVEWYDFVCFGIVGVSILVALWVLWINEGPSASHSDFDILVDSLLVAPPSQDNRVATGHVSNSQLWTSCWRGVHPLVLLVTRFSSLVILAVLLSLDIHEYNAIGDDGICIRMLEVVHQTSSTSKWGTSGVSEKRFGHQKFYQVAKSIC
ncbi:hypothetical protein L195_g026203 [Trifolium pratense]|uniref:Uncharacterized protein n=1 Tax=Trifolium pratense TaxID=57577 RepID=A0A2K3MIB7_TRIPR|nr:hypothetical protein L195_g046657 [Trifolium pratense]PNY02882.1 hypothetical protein L195_g026203 [Trifolium pratense]